MANLRKLLFNGPVNFGMIVSMRYAPDGGSGVNISISGGVIKIWDVATSREIASFTDRDRYGKLIFALAFSPDGQYLIGASGEVGRLWDITQQAISQTFIGHAGDVTCRRRA